MKYTMKSDCNLISRLYLACQARYGDVNKFSVMQVVLGHYLCHGEANYDFGQMQSYCLILKETQYHQNNPLQLTRKSNSCRCCCGSDDEARNS